jgi:peptide/nickel transport system substrate-binding protein
VSDDLKTWTFYLRKGVKFHHGRDVDAQDVIATVQRIQDKATGSVTRVNFEVIDKMEALDANTVRFTLKAPYAGLADIFSDRQAHIVPRDKLDMAREPIGLRPVQVQAVQARRSCRAGEEPGLLRPGDPALDGVVLRIMPESAAQAAALETGEVDLVWNLPLESIESFKKNPNFVVDSVATSTWDGVAMNGAHKPFNDPRVRRAVLLAVDKPAMVELALFGHGTPTHTMIPPGHPFYNNDIKIGKPDIAAAKKLLAEAGYPNGFDITLYTPVGRPTRERAGLAMREMLKPLNIKVDIQRVPWDKFINDIEGRRVLRRRLLQPADDRLVDLPLVPQQRLVEHHAWNYKNADMDKILEAARASRTEADLAGNYKKFQVLALEDPPGVIAYVLNHVNAYRKNVKGFQSSPMMWLDLRKVSVQ